MNPKTLVTFSASFCEHCISWNFNFLQNVGYVRNVSMLTCLIKTVNIVHIVCDKCKHTNTDSLEATVWFRTGENADIVK